MANKHAKAKNDPLDQNGPPSSIQRGRGQKRPGGELHNSPTEISGGLDGLVIFFSPSDPELGQILQRISDGDETGPGDLYQNYRIEFDPDTGVWLKHGNVSFE